MSWLGEILAGMHEALLHALWIKPVAKQAASGVRLGLSSDSEAWAVLRHLRADRLEMPGASW